MLGEGNRRENHIDWALREHMGTGKYPAVFSLVFFFRERWSNYHNRLCANQNRRAEESQAKAVLKDIIVAEML